MACFLFHILIQKRTQINGLSFCIENAEKGIDRTSYDLAVELKSEKKVIGGISLDKINKFSRDCLGRYLD